MDSPHSRAEQWYFNLLRAELDARGQGEVAELLPHFLRVPPPAEPPAAAIPGGGEVTLTLQQRFTEYEVRINALTGEPVSWFADFLSTNGDESLPHDKALELATETAQPPADAELESAAYETMADRTFFRARWIHRHLGFPVEGDFIEVLVNGLARRPFSVTRVWREPNLDAVPLER